jgi:hypothetical protein
MAYVGDSYFDSAVRRLEEFADYFKEEGIEEINTICSAHVLTLDVDEEKKFRYNGPDVQDGKLRMLFGPEYISTNISQALERDALVKALNDAPAGDDKPMGYTARTSKRQQYDEKIEEIRAKIAEILNNPDIKLTPNFEDTWAKLKEESKAKKNGLDRQWEQTIGDYIRMYFDGFRSQVGWQGFEDDDMLQEGFKEVVDKNEIAFRIVDKLKKKDYCEFEIEDGVLYIQVSPRYCP